jgi:hypothetical protein
MIVSLSYENLAENPRPQRYVMNRANYTTVCFTNLGQLNFLVVVQYKA